MNTCSLQLAAYKAFTESESISGFANSLIAILTDSIETNSFAIDIVLKSGMQITCGMKDSLPYVENIGSGSKFEGIFASSLQDIPTDFVTLLTELINKRIQETTKTHQHSSDTVARVLGITFHDVRNTLGSISGISQLLEMDAAGNQGVLNGIHDIISIINKFDESTTTVMKLIRGQEIKYTREQFSLSDMCNTILKRSTRVYQLSSITLTSSIQEGISCLGDELYTKEIFMELLTNAATALDGSGGTVTVEITSNKENIEISVGQSGSPVLPEVQEYIFLPFFTTKDKGRGMGLTKVARYLKDWGGKIVLSPLPDQPVRFVVTLPTTLP